jgi:ferric-dicitrate binding protein FerR (iron transport regulator)
LNNVPGHIDELISKYLAGEASHEEVSLVDTWAATHEENKKYLQQLAFIFRKAPEIQAWQDFDTDAAWSKMRNRIKEKSGKTVPLQPQRPFGFLRIAASIILVLGFGYAIYQIADNVSADAPSIAVVSSKETKSDTLPDGSNVFLNKLTEVDYAFDKKQKLHKVKLKGEAYFHVKHEDDKKFLVEAEGLYIRDIGTSFNVKAYPDGTTIEVVVEEGEVQFFSDENPGVYLKAGGRGIYNKKDKTFTVEAPEANMLAYKTKFFSFSNANLLEVVTALNDVYDQKIILSKNLEACHLTVSFNNETLSEISNIIGETLGLTVTVSPDGFLLEGNGCE